MNSIHGPTRIPATQPRPKFAVLGDIHANLEGLTAVLEDARQQGCTNYACVGDVVGYNANPVECIALVRHYDMACVKGNHDDYCSTDAPLTGIHPRAVVAAEWTRRQLGEADRQWLRELRHTRFVAGFSLVHATLDEPQNWGYVFGKFDAAASLAYQVTPVCFYGHTHLPMAFVRTDVVRSLQFTTLQVEVGRKYFVNVGTVGEPRDGSRLVSYVTYDLGAGVIQLHKVPFDSTASDAKALANGLPLRRRVDTPGSAAIWPAV